MKKILILLAIAIVGLTQCREEEEITQEQESYIYLDPEELFFDAEGGEDEIFVECTDVWEISGSADWCEVSSQSGLNAQYVYFNVEPSEDTDERSVTYTFVCGTASQELRVIQKQKDALTLTSSKFEIPAEGKEISIEVKANIDFNYEVTSGKEWIHRSETKAMEATVLNFIIDKNTEFNDRNGEIRIMPGDITEKITIHQAEALPFLNVSMSEYEVPAAGNTIVVDVSANVDYEYSITPYVEWVKFLQEKENGLEFEVVRNNLLKDREVSIEFYNEEYNLSSKVSINQIAYGLEDMLKTVHVETKGTLSNVLSESGAEDAEYLKITGVLNDVDFLTLNEMGKNNLVYLDLSEVDITVIPNDAMKNTNISSLFLPENLIEIGSGAFYGTKIEEVTIPETVEIIGNAAFYSCDALAKANIPTELKQMGYSVFAQCSSLQGDIVIPSTIETIGKYVFSGTAINSVTFKKGSATISVTESIFSRCKNLTSVIFEAGCMIESLQSLCFYGCTALSEIVIPASVTIIESSFEDCTSLKSVSFETGSRLTAIWNDSFSGCTSLSSITIPASVERIGVGFYGCTSLKEVKFEEESKLSEIGDGAFGNCTALTSITIPKGITNIQNSFKGCSSLSEVYFEENSQLEYIGNVFSDSGPSFYGCPLKIFDASNCTNLERLLNGPFSSNQISLFKLGTATPPELERDNLDIPGGIGTAANSILKVPDGSVEAYKNSDWSKYFSTISGLSE